MSSFWHDGYVGSTQIRICELTRTVLVLEFLFYYILLVSQNEKTFRWLIDRPSEVVAFGNLYSKELG